MWPFDTPRAQCTESCKKRHEELEDRVRKLELESTERSLVVLDAAEKVAARLADRVRKRQQQDEPQPTPERPKRPWELR